MSEPSSQQRPARGIRFLDRLGLGVLSLVQLFLVGIAVVSANYLGFQQYGRLDWSKTSDYSLSPATISLLESRTMRVRPAPVRWVLCFRRTAPFYERVRALAEEYVHRSGGAITLEIVDPLRSPDRTQEVVAGYGLTLVRDLLIMDARQDAGEAAIREDANQIKSLHPNIRLVTGDELATYAVEDGKRKISAFRGEDILTSRLVEAIEGAPKRMAFLADKTRYKPEAEDSPLRGLADRLRMQNIEFKPLAISMVEEIPEDIQGLVIMAPVFDFTEAEMQVIERFWSRPRAALLVVCEPAGVPTRLKAFLRAHGISPRRDRVVMPLKQGGVSTEVPARFAEGLPFLAGLAGQSTTWEGGTASVEVREGAEDLIARKIFPVGMIEAQAGAWGETRFGNGDEVFDETEDHAGPLQIAAACTRGAESDDRFAETTSRMVVMGNADFLSPARETRAENLDFLQSSVQWLMGRDAPLGIGPRALGVYKLPLLGAQVSFINRVNLIFLPAALLLIGGFVWSSRRV